MVERFDIVHLAEIELQPAQQYLREYLDDEALEHLRSASPGFTIRDGDGRVLLCACYVLYDSFALLVTYVSVHAAARFRWLRGHVQRLLEVSPAPRILATVECDFEPGMRCLELFGFVRDVTFEKFGPDGRDHVLFMRERP